MLLLCFQDIYDSNRKLFTSLWEMQSDRPFALFPSPLLTDDATSIGISVFLLSRASQDYRIALTL